MAAIPYDVAEAFLEGRKKTRGAFRTDGTYITSYNLTLAERTPFCPYGAHWVIDPETARAYSQTTARHVSALLAKLPY